jgi:HD-GYP domain-containing protein (c-di-GMP phosphodiesterase class II)
MVEYIRPEEFCKQLLDEIWQAMQSSAEGLQICILRKDRPRFDDTIDRVRRSKIDVLKQKFPHLDQKALDLYGNLSAASQLVVSGGLEAHVVEKVKASAAFLVANIIDSDSAISTLSRMITCDPTLYDHSATVAMISSVIGLRVLPKPLTLKEAQLLSQGALYHDVGKTCVPNAILNKPAKLTADEFEVMKKHTELGYDELRRQIEAGLPIDELAARVALEHHEKWDGKGYPHGRRGALEDDPDNGIHKFSRIVTIADIYSALLMKRVYKPSFEPQDAIKVMAEEASGFDPALFIPFLKGVVSSLNAERAKAKLKGRILVMEKDGSLTEWTAPKKTG